MGINRIFMILITGGAGFIGTFLVDKLLKNGESVKIFDNFSNSSKQKITNFLDRGALLVEGDIRDYKILEKSLASCSSVIHLAAQIDVEKSILFPKETHEINVEGTKNLLKACNKQNVRNIIAASSAAVYGIPSELPLTESSSTKPISPYGESKLVMERLIEEFSKKNTLNSISLRFFNIYGVGQTIAYAGVITKFLKNILDDKPLTIFGDGTNTRDFISVDDVVNSITCSLKKMSGKTGNRYNIASGNIITINDLATTMLSLADKTLEIKYQSARKGDIPHSQANINLSKNELNFIPNIPLRLGLEKLIKYNLNNNFET